MIVINICLKFDHLFIGCPVHDIMQNRGSPFKLRSRRISITLYYVGIRSRRLAINFKNVHTTVCEVLNTILFQMYVPFIIVTTCW